MIKTIKLLFAILLVAIAVLMYFPIKPEIIYPVESLEQRIGEKQDYCATFGESVDSEGNCIETEPMILEPECGECKG